METTTCTYGPMATTGKPCGKPAVATFGAFGECETHRVEAITKAATHLIVGAHATLRIHGMTKVVKVVAIHRTRATVEVGTTRGTRLHKVPLAELGL